MLFVVCWSTGRNRLTVKRRWLTDRPSKTSCRSSAGRATRCSTFAALTSRSSACRWCPDAVSYCEQASRYTSTPVRARTWKHTPCRTRTCTQNCCREAAQAWRGLFWRRCEEKKWNCVFSNLPSGRSPKSCLWWQKVKRLWKFYSWGTTWAPASTSKVTPSPARARRTSHIILSSLSSFSSSSNH